MTTVLPDTGPLRYHPGMAAALSPSEHLLLDRFAARLVDLAGPGAVADIRVFGSRARGSSGPGSDLDVAVWPVPGADRVRLRRLARDAAEDAMEALGLAGLRLSPVVMPEGGTTPLDRAVAEEGIAVWPDP